MYDAKQQKVSWLRSRNPDAFQLGVSTALLLKSQGHHRLWLGDADIKWQISDTAQINPKQIGDFREFS